MSSELSQALLNATRIVERFAFGNLSARQFVDQYANFYYFEALDGHESSSAQDSDQRSKHWLAIELHRRVQTEVVDALALDSLYTEEQLREAGRIGESEGRLRAKTICGVVGLSAILESLGY